MGLILIILGFKFPGALDKLYLKEFEFMVKEHGEIESKIKKILASECTVETIREWEKLQHEKSRRLKDNEKVAILRGELNLRVILSQIMILLGACFVAGGTTYWFSDWKRGKERQSFLKI